MVDRFELLSYQDESVITMWLILTGVFGNNKHSYTKCSNPVVLLLTAREINQFNVKLNEDSMCKFERMRLGPEMVIESIQSN